MAAKSAAAAYNVAAIRKEFPILSTKVHGKPLVYLDNAATTQKPKAVLDAMTRYYAEENSNVHRGVHHLSEVATKSYEGARDAVRRFVNAPSSEGVVFTRGTTEAINLVAASFGRPRLKPGDEILVTGMEHHSNIVPWQLACQATGAKLKVVPVTDAGELDLAAFGKLLSAKTKLFAVTHVSNALGTVNPVRELVAQAHAKKVPVLVDGAQAVPHTKVDIQKIGADFYAFSGHKLYGPTGIGILAANVEHLEAMPPWQGGGDMIRSVTFEGSTWNDLPYKFEAGTPAIAPAVGLGAAVEFVSRIGLDAIAAHEHKLLQQATAAVEDLPGLRIVGQAKDKASVLSFHIEGVHPHDIGSLLDRDGIAVRTGHHCAQPVMDRFGIPATTRASFGLYNTKDEVEVFASSLKRVVELFR